MRTLSRQLAADETPLRYGDQMVSYAQWGEDVVLRRFFGGQPTGFYVDVGANDPVLDSVTLHFCLSGWSGINIEPLPDLHRKLVAARPRDVNLNVALSSHPGALELVVNHTAPGLTSACEELVRHYEGQGHRLERVRVPAMTLAQVAGEHCAGRTVDFLKLDAEGHEAEILAGVDLRSWRPRVIVVEAGYRHEAWEPGLLESGYRLAGLDPVNRYYLREEEAERAGLLSVPANVGDRFLTRELLRARQVHDQWDALGPALQRITLALRAAKDASPAAKRVLKKAARLLVPRLFD